MTGRWRGRTWGPAILGTLLLGATIAATGASESRDPMLIVRGPDGAVIARLRLSGGEFTLRYRNSVYRSFAEERYVVDPRGRIHLAALAADELAVLEEYYAIDEPAWPAGDGARTWMAKPARPVVIERLTVAATDLGRRTLIVEGQPPMELWRLVEDAAPSIHLEVVLP